MLLLIYFNYRLSFPINSFNLKCIISYLVCRNPQHKVTSTYLWRQFSILLCQMLEALGQALTITDAVFCFGPVTHLVLIRLRGSVYYSCSQHLSRTGSSYQCIKTDLKISVQLWQHINKTIISTSYNTIPPTQVQQNVIQIIQKCIKN